MANKNVSSQEKALQRHKRLNSDLGLATAALGAGALVTRGAGFASGRMKLKALNAARSAKSLEPLSRNDPSLARDASFKVPNRLNNAGNAVGAVGAGAAAGTGVSASLAQKKELDIKQGKERAYKEQLAQMSPKKKILKKNLNDSRKKYFYQNNIEQRRNMRNKAYPAAAATGSAVAAGAAGGLAVGNYKKGKYVKKEKAFAAARDTNQVKADNLTTEGNQHIADSKAHKATAEKYTAMRDRLVRRVETKGFSPQGVQANRRYQTKHTIASGDAGKASKESAKTGSKVLGEAKKYRTSADTAEQSRLKTVKTLGQKRYTKLPGKKATLAVAGVSAGLAGLSVAARRNNKKGVTRPRHDWWQG